MKITRTVVFNTALISLSAAVVLFSPHSSPPGILPPAGSGSINPSVTEANIQETICKSGWTATIRPPVSFTNKLKASQIAQEGLKDTNPTHYEEDHIISLELGGSPSDPNNLWPQPYEGNAHIVYIAGKEYIQATTSATAPLNLGAHQKDVVETVLKTKVCAGVMSLADAQKIIKTDWVGAYLQIKNITIPESDTDQ